MRLNKLGEELQKTVIFGNFVIKKQVLLAYSFQKIFSIDQNLKALSREMIILMGNNICS